MTKPKTNRERTLVIDKPACSMLLRIFDCCYKLGVNDAAEVNDTGLCREHIERMQQPAVFGRVNDDTSTDWLYWQLTLKSAILNNRLYKSAFSAFERYTMNAGYLNRNFMGVFYSIAKCFYEHGLEDWIACSRQCDLSVFNSSPKLKLQKGGKMKVWKISDMVSDAQRDCFRLMKIHKDRYVRKYAHTEMQFTTFMRCLAQASASRYDMIS